MSSLSLDQLAFFNQPEHQPFTGGAGPTGALLIHGFAGTPAEMRPLANQLAESISTEVILLPGFGQNIAELGDTSYGDWLTSAREAWRAMNARSEDSFLIGFSLGGALALHLAAEQPPAGLVLIAPFWRIDNWSFRLLPVLKHLVEYWRPFEDANFDDPATREQLRVMMPDVNLDEPETREFLRNEVKLPLAALDEVRRLGEETYRLASAVTVPTLIVQGLDDDTVTPPMTRKLAERLSGPVTLHQLESDHQVIRHPDLFIAELNQFLRENSVPR